MFKQTLRQRLEGIFSNTELSRWFDPLNVHVDEKKGLLQISFPHQYFADWFMASIRQDFESQASVFAGNLAISYENNLQVHAVQAQRPKLSIQRTADPGPAENSPLGKSMQAPLQESQDLLLHEQHIFETFLVNRKNDFPLMAAKECVSKASKPPYTPFVVYGQSGSGKSHLLGAMANTLRNNGSTLYFGGIAYLNRITDAPGKHPQITEQYVFIDDAQRIESSHNAQDALAALIDIFQVSGKLLALSFDAHPAQYSGFGQKLRSRLVSGLVVEMKQPDIDIRQQYVQRKNAEYDLCLSKEQILAISHRYQDIWSIDGALARLSTYRDLIPPQSTDGAPSDILSILDRREEHPFLTPDSIILTVAKAFSLPPEEVTGKNKDKTVSLARHIAILLCRELLGLSLIQVGRIFSGRDHSSILYSIKKVKQLQSSDKIMHKRVEELRKLCLTKH